LYFTRLFCGFLTVPSLSPKPQTCDNTEQE
jgi:hypothetical protein